MSEENFRKEYLFINNTLFTEYDVPLSVSDDEKILYFNHNAKFSLVIGNGEPLLTARYNSYKGSLYLTNKRVIYKPLKSIRNFNSFFISLKDIIKVENDSYFEIRIEDSYSSNVYINCEDSQTNVFFTQLKKLLPEYMKNEYKSSYINENFETLPLYCEVIYENNNSNFKENNKKFKKE